ncbi:unnamed protein product [Cylindrotheca closterium]|uniref:RNI-like protein n=1 Tax=Cylindrotheca closterium TaxID=2856 RepID=A0AAD2FRZ6_9STRA|nr:unnamed protein product [Cylindrotheca closterium]
MSSHGEYELDRILLDLGCFAQHFRPQSLHEICRLALQPRDPSAIIVDQQVPNEPEEDAEDETDGPIATLEEALVKHNTSETLLLQHFDDDAHDDASQSETKTELEPETETETAKVDLEVKHLCFSHCSVPKSVVKTIEQSELEVLIIWNSRLETLPKIRSLKSLVVVDSFIHPNDIAWLLENSKSLERLILIRAGDIPSIEKKQGYCISESSSRFYKSPVLSPFFQALLDSNIKTLVLERNVLPTPDLAHVIEKHAHLEAVSLRNVSFSDYFAYAIAQALKNGAKSLEHLDMKQVYWSPIGAFHICNSIRMHKTISHLDLSETMWNGRQSKLALYQMILGNTSLRHLDLGRIASTDWSPSSTMCPIFEALQSNHTITSICLTRNRFCPHATYMLDRVLSMHPSLNRIDLSQCAFPQGFGRALRGLASNSTLKELSLEHCRIGDEGANAIGTVLQSNQTLKSIDLCHNGIGTDGAKSLARGLEYNQTLHNIFLHGNQINETSAAQIRDTVRDHNHSLRVVFLPNSHFQEELQYYGSINYAGRKQIGDLTLKRPLWPTILERASDHPDMLYFLLRQNPNLFPQEETTTTKEERPNKKRRLAKC